MELRLFSIQIEPRIKHLNMVGLVHHIVVYTCNMEQTNIIKAEGEACYFALMKPPNVTVCDSVIFAYAVGMEASVFQ